MAVLDSAVVWTHECLQLARAVPLRAPTPCTDWDLGLLLAHMQDSLEAFAEAAELGRVVVPPAAPPFDADRLVDRLIAQACLMRAAWHQRVTSAPINVNGLRLGRDTTVLVGSLEIAVHGWDVAAAAGRPRPVPEDLAIWLYDVARAVVTPSERGSRFGPAVPVPAGARVGQHLLAHLGREPV